MLENTQKEKNSSAILAQGKTKIIHQYQPNEYFVVVESKNDITAHNAVKHDIMAGKAEYATQTTCNVFRLLKSCGMPIAFEKQIDTTKFLAPYCTMIPYEVVIRREGHGSYIKRNPMLQKGHVFPKLLCEFFLKTTNRQWKNTEIPKDDPFIRFNNNSAELYLPDTPLFNQQPFLTLHEYPLQDKPQLFETMSAIARQAFLILEKSWQQLGCRLVDFKVEFGFDKNNNLLLADVIDNDSWRVVHDGCYIDKQAYRDGAQLDTVIALYQKVSQLTGQFCLPKQRIVIWRGSDKDDVSALLQAAEPLKQYNIETTCITLSMHKEPGKSYQTLQKIAQEIPDSVIIALIGRSNGAGPTLSANTTLPVITVPVGWDKFPEDVWSSVRGPSEVPVMTVLDQNNALLAALNILASRNQGLYGQLRSKQEQRHHNYAELA